MNNQPNLFIVGAAKCGTTAMAEYLKKHENIFFTTPKEPHYFATDMPGYQVVNNFEEYLNLFSNATEKHLYKGEASVYYIYSKEAIKNIYNFNPDAKIIVMLRNPIEMVYSLHAQLIKTANEDILDFEEAWNLIQKRKNKQYLPKYSKDHQVLYYDEIAKFADQLTNIYNYFPKKQVHIILFDDFQKDTAKTYNNVLKFLQLPRSSTIKFEKINQNAVPKNHLLNYLLRKQPYGIKKIKNIIKSILGVKELGIVKKLVNINIKIEKRISLDKEFKNKILQTYIQDINKLEKLLKKDLSSWKK